MSSSSLPAGEPAIRILAMPSDTNANGDIFGGWLMSQMDIAGAIVAMRRCAGRAVTIAVDSMTFLKPVYVGDVVSCYGKITRVGRTSLQVAVEAWAQRSSGTIEERVTEGVFTYVAIGSDRRPRPVLPE